MDREMTAGEEGVILVQGPGVFRDYWNDPSSTQQAFHDGFLNTGAPLPLPAPLHPPACGNAGLRPTRSAFSFSCGTQSSPLRISFRSHAYATATAAALDQVMFRTAQRAHEMIECTNYLSTLSGGSARGSAHACCTRSTMLVALMLLRWSATMHRRWLGAGDLGRLVPPGSRMESQLVITGRAKDTIVIASGENISPQPIEDALSRSPIIRHCILFGQDKRTLGALVSIDEDAMRVYMEVRSSGGTFQLPGLPFVGSHPQQTVSTNQWLLR
jgi:acyl-CoA synthetase (AMP-forming)/AMP-acid ligase II